MLDEVIWDSNVSDWQQFNKPRKDTYINHMLNLKYCTSKDALFFPVTEELVLTQSRNWFTDFPYIKDMRTEIVTMWLHLAVALCLP